MIIGQLLLALLILATTITAISEIARNKKLKNQYKKSHRFGETFNEFKKRNK